MTIVSETQLLCLRCGNEWKYEGSSARAVCKRCNYRFRIGSKEKHYVCVDLKEYGQGIINAVKSSQRFAVLDCEGTNVVDVSIID